MYVYVCVYRYHATNATVEFKNSPWLHFFKVSELQVQTHGDLELILVKSPLQKEYNKLNFIFGELQ